MNILDLPETRYAQSDGLHIAYQELGHGPLNFVVVMGLWSHLDFWHEVPGYTNFLRGLGKLGRVVVFDKRGYGLSDRWSRVPTLEERMDDVRAVMDSVGMERAAVLAWSEGVPLSLLFASSYPERVTHLLLFEGAARWPAAPGYVGMPRSSVEEYMDNLIEHWGTTQSVQTIDTRIAADPELAAIYAKGERMVLRQNEVAAAIRWIFDVDVRELLPHVLVPTLVMARSESPLIEQCRYMHSHIAGSEIAVFGGNWHAPWGIGDESEILERIGGFLAHCEEHIAGERVLATVVACELLPDRGARIEPHRLALHREMARALAKANRGMVVQHGDGGLIATFDGPARAITFAGELCERTRALPGLRLRAGVHTGEIERRTGGIAGPAADLTAGVCRRAGAGEVLVSRTVVDLVLGSGMSFTSRGTVAVAGYSTPWALYALRGYGEAPRREYPDGLSHREAEILQALARGKRNREIAKELCITQATVTRHVSNILAKTGLTNRTEAAAYAIVKGLTNDDETADRYRDDNGSKHQRPRERIVRERAGKGGRVAPNAE